jgi:hypothetical protein
MRHSAPNVLSIYKNMSNPRAHGDRTHHGLISPPSAIHYDDETVQYNIGRCRTSTRETHDSIVII